MKPYFGFNRDLWILRRKNAILVGGTVAVLSMMGRESLSIQTLFIFHVKNVKRSEGRESTVCVDEEGQETKRCQSQQRHRIISLEEISQLRSMTTATSNHFQMFFTCRDICYLQVHFCKISLCHRRHDLHIQWSAHRVARTVAQAKSQDRSKGRTKGQGVKARQNWACTLCRRP